MNEFILKEYTPQYIIYLYQPEGRGEWGEVLYDFSDGQAKITKRAGENSTWHDNHAITQIEKCAKENHLSKKFTQAWY